MAEYIVKDFGSIREGVSYKGLQFEVIINDVVEDLTGVKIEFYYGSDNVFLTTENDSVIIDTPLEGKFQIPEQVLALRQGEYDYDCKFTYPTGKVKIYMIGHIIITR